VKAGFLIFFLLISTPSGEMEDRILQTVREIDSFEFAIYGIRKYIEDLEKEELFLKETVETFSILSNLFEEIISIDERLLKDSLKTLVLFHTSSKRIFPTNMKKYEVWKIMETMSRKSAKEFRDAINDYTKMKGRLDEINRETRTFLEEISELKEEKEYIKLLSISAIAKRADVLRILRNDETLRKTYRERIEDKLGELSEKEILNIPHFLYPLPASRIIDKKEIEGGWFIETPKGTPVMAVRTGKVVYAGWLTGYGNTIVLQHEEYYSVYAHLDEVFVTKDEIVLSGEEIGKVGDTGSIYGIGLYFEIRYGKKKMDLKEIYKNF
jgi:murein DD-endopeptidase MepM/ murein hydrolase activator NlpD